MSDLVQPIAWRIYKSKGDWQEITASHTVAKRKKAEGYFVDPLYPGVAQADRIEALEAALENAAKIADSFTCGICGMDGKAGAAIRAALAPETEK